MDFDNVADNEDQLYRELLETEEKDQQSKKTKKISNNYDDETEDDY